MTEYFLSCDWGTSSFRLKYVRIHDLHVSGEVTSGPGIAATFAAYEMQPVKSDSVRQAFYLSVLSERITELAQQLSLSLDHVPVVLSGMASSTIGILSLPYATLPFSVSGEGIHTYLVKATAAFKHDVLIISGVCSDDDVIRGEETQLIGCIKDEPTAEEQLYIFPGTHSKHIVVKNGAAVSFVTYMTGEFFALLSAKSILSGAVKQGDTEDMDSFMAGVAVAAKSNLLHAAFLTRTNDLFSKYTKEENYNFLSGVAIGSELKELKSVTSTIYLCCSSNLQKYYAAALQALGLDGRVKTYPAEWVDSSVVRGQLKIFETTVRS